MIISDRPQNKSQIILQKIILEKVDFKHSNILNFLLLQLNKLVRILVKAIF